MYDNLCRSCLKPLTNASDIVPLFETYKTIYYLPSMICNLILTQVDVNDEMSKNVCIPCADKIVEFYEFNTMYLESDRKLREMISAKNEPSLSALMPFIKDEFEAGTQKSFDGEPEAHKWICNKCPARYRTRQHLRQHKRNHRKRYDIDDGYVKLEQGDNWLDVMASNKVTGDEKEIDTYQPEVILSITEGDPNEKSPMKNDKVWRCSKCMVDFQTRRQLREHRRGHREEELAKRGTEVSSALPVEQFKVAISMDIPTVNTDTLNLTANEPGEMFDRNGPSKWKCRECPKIFKARDFLRKHKQIHRHIKSNRIDAAVQRAESEHGKWLCHLCLSPFPTRNQLREHKQEHRIQKKLDTATTYNIDGIVAAAAKFSCDFCQTFFTSNDEMNKHLESHNINITVPIIQTQEILNGQKSLKCPQCDQTFSYQYHLKMHMKLHDGERSTLNSNHIVVANERKTNLKFICKVCSKGFNRNDNLKAHMYTHTQQYPHRCNYCGAGFVRKYKLRNHEEKCPQNRMNNKVFEANGIKCNRKN